LIDAITVVDKVVDRDIGESPTLTVIRHTAEKTVGNVSEAVKKLSREVR
jgi:hypothetical protein